MNDSLLSSISVDHELLKTWSNDFILLREQENRRRMYGPGICDAVELARNLRGNRSREQPKIPPAIFLQNQLSQRWWIVQYQACYSSFCRDIQCGRRPNACSENHNRTLTGFAQQRIERSQRGGR